jgi:hypothetical protein
MVAPYPSRGVVTTGDLSTDSDVLPSFPGTDFLVERASEFSTGLTKSASGREVAVAYYSAPLYRWKLKINVLRARAALNEVAALAGFYGSRLGRWGCFFYQDPVDNVVSAEPFATGDGTTRTFQLSRTVNRGGVASYVEPVYACWNAPTFTAAGSPVSGVTVAPWGLVTFPTAPANGAAIAWSGSYLFVCRFDQDDLTLAAIAAQLWSQDGLQFVSRRP